MKISFTRFRLFVLLIIITVTLGCGSLSNSNMSNKANTSQRCAGGALSNDQPYDSVSKALPGDPNALAIVELSRDAGSSAGGTSLLITGANFAAGMSVLFGSTPALSIGINSPTEISVTVPPHAPALVDVRVTKGTENDVLLKSFYYLPAPSEIYISHDFEDGTSGGFNGAGMTSTNLTANSGLLSIMGYKPHPSADWGRELSYTYDNPKNPPTANATGLYQHWYQRIPASSIINSAPGQIKMLLNRLDDWTITDSYGWLMSGIGAEFGSSPMGLHVSTRDYGGIALPGGNADGGFVIQGDTWHEFQTWYCYTNGKAYVKTWLDGKGYVDTFQTEFMGSANLSHALNWRFGIVWKQHVIGDLTVYLDDAAAANGFIDPVP